MNIVISGSSPCIGERHCFGLPVPRVVNLAGLFWVMDQTERQRPQSSPLYTPLSGTQVYNPWTALNTYHMLYTLLPNSHNKAVFLLRCVQ
jgi:hypothetical protein